MRGVNCPAGLRWGVPRIALDSRSEFRNCAAQANKEFFAAGSTSARHRIGQRVERALTAQAALRMAALAWTVNARLISVDG